MTSPINKQVSGIFIPVRDIQLAKEWYCDIFDFEPSGEILHGHLYILPMQNVNVILDSRIYSEDKIFRVPAFQFGTDNIKEAYAFMESKNVNLATEVQYNQWFNFKDPDGNLLMICECH